MRQKERGQSIVELALMLPILVLLVVGLVESGYAMRNYLLVMASNREGVRFAARGRFTDDAVARQIVTSGGVAQTDDGIAPFLRTHGNAPNTGIIITHIYIPADGSPTDVAVSQYVSGTISLEGTPRAIGVSDSRIDIVSTVDRSISATLQINDLRAAAGYERLDSEVIVLEVFYSHNTLWNYSIAIQDPWVMYTQSSMRVVTDSRSD